MIYPYMLHQLMQINLICGKHSDDKYTNTPWNWFLRLIFRPSIYVCMYTIYIYIYIYIYILYADFIEDDIFFSCSQGRCCKWRWRLLFNNYLNLRSFDPITLSLSLSTYIYIYIYVYIYISGGWFGCFFYRIYIYIYIYIYVYIYNL